MHLQVFCEMPLSLRIWLILKLPGAQKVIDFVKSGAVGGCLEVEASFLHSSDINPDKVINWKRMQDINGEYGCMGDLGMHVAVRSASAGTPKPCRPAL